MIRNMYCKPKVTYSTHTKQQYLFYDFWEFEFIYEKKCIRLNNLLVFLKSINKIKGNESAVFGGDLGVKLLVASSFNMFWL